MKQSTIAKILISLVAILYLGVSLVSTFHVIDFFKLTNVGWAAILLAVMFEVGQMGTLFLITSDVMKKVKKNIVWALFILLTAMQVMGNMYYAYTHANGFGEWAELFSLENEPVIFQKRILAIVAGAILPLIALGFVKALSDYLNPDDKKEKVDKPKEDLGLLLDSDKRSGPIGTSEPQERLIIEEPNKTAEVAEVTETPEKPKQESIDIVDLAVNTLTEELEKAKEIEEEVAPSVSESIKDNVLEKIRVYKK